LIPNPVLTYIYPTPHSKELVQCTRTTWEHKESRHKRVARTWRFVVSSRSNPPRRRLQNGHCQSGHHWPDAIRSHQALMNVPKQTKRLFGWTSIGQANSNNTWTMWHPQCAAKRSFLPYDQ